MTVLWPELLVLLLFLGADIAWSGMSAAAAGAAAGLVSYGVLFISGRRKPSLLIEGLIFGGVTALGELVSFPGGNIILMELFLGVILLVSVPLGWRVMERMAGSLGRGMFSGARSDVLTIAMGIVFTLHGGLYAIVSLLGAGSLPAGIALFAILYFAAIRLSSKGMKKAAAAELPELVETDDGRAVIRKGEAILGEFQMDTGVPGLVRITNLAVDHPLHRFLPSMEKALARAGYTAVMISGKQIDELELEMNGFIEYEGEWRKGLRGR